MRVLVSKTVIPKEASSIAARFDNIASRLDALAANLDQISGNLNNTWEGQAKNRFFADFSGEPSQLRSVAEYCRQSSRNVRRMKVTILEYKEVNQA